MATRLYSIARGAGLTRSSVTEAVGSATATAAIEVTFDLGSSLTKEDVLKGLDLIREYILQDTFPPA